MSSAHPSVVAPTMAVDGRDAPDLAAAVFGAQVAQAVAYAELLRGDGARRGLLGPRESERIWERHLLNCAVITDLIPADAMVVDVGSGAGLPGIAMALRRADLRLVLVESLQRRVDFLNDAVGLLGLADRVSVLRGRAEDGPVRRRLEGSQWVTARAVAPLDRLARWCLPLLAPGGHLLAVKGSSAAAELARTEAALRAAGADRAEIRQCGADVLSEPTTVVDVRKASRQVSARISRGRS